MFGFGFSTYQLGLRLTLPIRNRAASADMADAIVRKKQDTLTVRNTQQTIRLSVLNAVTNVESSRESVKLAKERSDFAQKNSGCRQQEVRVGYRTSAGRVQRAGAQGAGGIHVVTNQIAGPQEPDQSAGADRHPAGRARYRNPALSSSGREEPTGLPLPPRCAPHFRHVRPTSEHPKFPPIRPTA